MREIGYIFFLICSLMCSRKFCSLKLNYNLSFGKGKFTLTDQVLNWAVLLKFIQIQVTKLHKAVTK